MKNLLAIIFLFSACIVHSQTSFSLGGGYERNLTADLNGINLRAYYNIGEHFCFGQEFSGFLSKTTENDDEREELFVREFNFNVHYIFEIADKFGVYPYVGLNYTREREELTLINSTESPEVERETSWGANFGAGFHAPFNQVVPFVEYHFTTGSDEHVVTLGVFYIFRKEESKEE